MAGFTGHKHNDDIGLIYMNARYYLPSVGRFVSADTIVPNPVNPQSYNRFSYVRNNPLNLVDPTGHFDCPDPDAGCAPPPTTTEPIVPDWWLEENRISVEGYGIFDVGHIERGHRSAIYLMGELEKGNTYIKMSSGDEFIYFYELDYTVK